MKKLFCFLFTLLLGVAVVASAQEKGGKAKKDETRVDGRVVMINKDTSTITVTEGKTKAQRQVVYSASTAFTYRNEKGAIGDVKDGMRVICLGKFDEKGRLMATRVDVREGR